MVYRWRKLGNSAVFVVPYIVNLGNAGRRSETGLVGIVYGLWTVNVVGWIECTTKGRATLFITSKPGRRERYSIR